jgi:hypothetical protein
MKLGRPLIALIKLCYTASRPILLVGRHGVGKSAILEQAAEELGVGFICRDLSLMEPPDLVGIPRTDGSVTRYAPPSFLPTDGRGLLVFEELNRCPSYMRSPCLQLLTARCLNDYRLPPGWLPVAAINPDDAGYEVEGLDSALSSRFVVIDVEPDLEEWLHWARAGKVHADVTGYVGSDPAIFKEPRSNPRSWAYVSDLLVAAGGAGTTAEVLREAVAGLVGRPRMVALFRARARGHRGDDKPLEADEVLKGYRRHRDRLRSWIASGRLDLVEGSSLAVRKRLQAQPDYADARRHRAAWKHLGAFVADLPGDLQEQMREFFESRGYDTPGPRKGK